MEPEGKDTDAPADGAAGIDWESRRLCSDENCIGVIGPDGRCKECARPHGPGAIPEVREAAPPAAAEQADRPPAGNDSGGRPDDDWESRRLCSDENCIGVIGPDGRCRECGKPYAG